MSENEGNSWEIRAFEEDAAANLMGCAWPPRSYTCTFCRREFRSAQALGGHMNVHRRDRARLHHEAPPIAIGTSAAAAMKEPSSSLLIRTSQECLHNGLCLVYPLTNHNAVLIPTAPMDSSSTCLCIPPSATNMAANNSDESVKGSTNFDGLDLELRLGQRQSSPSP